MEELEASLGAYEGQLTQVEGAPQSDPSNSELKQLTSPYPRSSARITRMLGFWALALEFKMSMAQQLLLLLLLVGFSLVGAQVARPQRTSAQRRQTMSKHSNKKDAPQRSFHTSIIAGVSSGIVSSVLCAPLDLVRTRLQVWGELQTTKPQYIFGMLGDIFRKEGLKGCFRGLSATLLTVPTFWGVYCTYTTACRSLQSTAFYEISLSSFLHFFNKQFHYTKNSNTGGPILTSRKQ